ncbi:phage baseplate protein [Cupriavidus alkaliphilus]|uniref:phage baseplate protein n=1 Tax=Cupriavidus alkaliphilus TaxID=942866 RepID=UPI00160B66D7|nr:hypothetical protein [Cupriavidus alkaliphilus]MBB2918336.1 hypothetical protein [Cupriavidus alkaliphilus]
MSFVSLVFDSGTARSSVGAILLDALLNEETSLSSQATSYAVEDGAPISDHVVLESERLSLSGWITAADTVLFGAGGRSKLIAAKEALRNIHKERLPVVVVTGMDSYADMVMETCKISRDSKGEFFEVSCDFRRIRKVTLRTADIPPEKVSARDGGKAKGKAGSTKTNAGKVDGKEGTEKQKSDLRRILGSVFGKK